MKKVLSVSILSMLAFAGIANASCSDGLTEKTWDKTASGYCKIFFPDCSKDSLGKRLSYSREFTPEEVICTGQGGQYQQFYRVTIKDANEAFKTDFEKLGVNYTSELSQWLFDSCRDYCDNPDLVSIE